MMMGIVAGQAMRPQPLNVWEHTVCQFQFDGDVIDQKGGAFSQVGAISYTAGRWGQAVALDGSESGIVSDVVNPLYGFAGDFTIEFYARIPSAANGAALIAHFHTNDTAGWEVYYESNTRRLRFYQYLGGGSYPITSNQAAGDGVMRRYAITRQGSTLRMYFDTTLVGTAVNTTIFGSEGLYLSIGYQAQGAARYPLLGLIDSLRIVNGIAIDMSTLPAGPFPAY